MTEKKPGRKRIRTETEMIQVYLSPTQRREIQAAAGIEGQQPSVFLRTVGLERAREIVRKFKGEDSI